MRYILTRTFALLAAVIMLGACEKNELPEITEAYNVSTKAKVKFFFHSQGAPAAAFYVNDVKVTAIAPVATGATAGQLRGQGFGTVFPNNNYAEVDAGSFKMRVIDVEASKTAGQLVELTAKEITLEPATFYSAYFVGVPATATSPATYEIHLARDNQPVSDFSKVWWRFVNTMAEAPFKVDAYAVKAKVPATATAPEVPAVIVPLGMNLDYKQQGDYVQLPVVGTWVFKVYPSGTTYDPETSAPYISHSLAVTNSHFGRVYTTQIRGKYEAPVPPSITPVTTGKIDYWRER
ncbi:DUF4397 domain-containing protein [Rufibacter immobilis]|uniref:DUF4397 domain-containing protein n=1 Tax=Rufibacter immobilis TaxID=1348778 RepID=A0A3M9N3L4_9BACT|nr:DUF4397 domain-containing protein [Rufibacter immobilis]RNI32339.1 DUF4397 domain-containing protein [Rufibacter immobilis]